MIELYGLEGGGVSGLKLRCIGTNGNFDPNQLETPRYRRDTTDMYIYLTTTNGASLFHNLWGVNGEAQRGFEESNVVSSE